MTRLPGASRTRPRPVGRAGTPSVTHRSDMLGASTWRADNDVPELLRRFGQPTDGYLETFGTAGLPDHGQPTGTSPRSRLAC